MNKKGFTLVELLGVIILITLISLLAFPTILNKIKQTSDSIDSATEKLIISSAKLYVSDNPNKFSSDYSYTSCISIQDLIKSNYIDKDIVNNSKSVIDKYVKVTNIDSFSYSITSSNECNYNELVLNGTDPVLNGLTPVFYDGNDWIIVDGKSNWYNYEKQQWANAVVLADGIEKSVGDVLNVDTDVLAMLVWIPRYEYKIEGAYGIHTDGTAGTQSLPGEIKVNFIDDSKTMATSGYILHPAFTFGTDKLNGIWVGKFETSHVDLSSSTVNNNLGCTNDSCNNASGLRIIPNVQSLRYNDISNMFYASRNLQTAYNLTNIDTHIMKNTEWGAVAYLSQSKYGKYGNAKYVGADKEVYINNSSDYYTGGEIDGYKTNISQSTTGNITGIYDVSGGAWEYVMGNYDNTISFSGFREMPNSKYYDLYTTLNSISACNNDVCYGHALNETRNWYNDSAVFADSDSPWLARGGLYSFGSNSGILFFDAYDGGSNGGASFRITFIGNP